MRKLIVQMPDGTVLVVPRSAKSPCAIAMRADRPQVDRTVSPASRVIDFGRRRAAKGAEAAVPLDNACEDLGRNQALPTGVPTSL